MAAEISQVGRAIKRFVGVARKFRSAVALLPFIALGCGYQFQGSGTVLPPDIKTVAIAPVENETTESSLSLKFREALRSRFERYGVLTVIDSQTAADAVLTSKILSINTRVRAVSGSTDVAVSQDLTMTIAAELKRRNGQILWKDNSLQASQPFADTGSSVVTGSSAFAQAGINAQELGTLDDLQVSRGQKDQTLADLVEETSRKLYLSAVAADF